MSCGSNKEKTTYIHSILNEYNLHIRHPSHSIGFEFATIYFPHGWNFFPTEAKIFNVYLFNEKVL